MTTVTLFKNHNGNVHVAIPVENTVRTVAFTGGKFWTTDTRLQAALAAAAVSGEYGIFIDPVDNEIDPNAATPMDQMKKRMREELLAELKAEGKIVDAGMSHQAPLQTGLANTQSVPGQQRNIGQMEQELIDQQRQQISQQQPLNPIPLNGTEPNNGQPDEPITTTNQTTVIDGTQSSQSIPPVDPALNSDVTQTSALSALEKLKAAQAKQGS